MIRLLNFRSARFRTSLFFFVFSLTAIMLSLVLYYQNTADFHLEDWDRRLSNVAVDLSRETKMDPEGRLLISPDILSKPEKLYPFINGELFMEIRDERGTSLLRSKALGSSSLPLTEKQLVSALKGNILFSNTHKSDFLPTAGETRFRMIVLLIDRPALPDLIMQIAIPEHHMQMEFDSLIKNLFSFILPITLFTIFLAGYFFSKRAFDPLERIISKARQIEAQNLSERLPVPRSGDEFEQLSITLNQLLDRLQTTFEAQSRFVNEAAHQLQTPLAILRGELDVFRTKSRSKEEGRVLFASISDEVDHIVRLVDKLLLLARLDTDLNSLPQSTIRLDEILLETVSRLTKIADAKKVLIQFNLAPQEPLPLYEVRGESSLLVSAFENLINNAVKFTSPDSKVEITLTKTANDFLVSIRDEGPGIPVEDQPLIFQRFFVGSRHYSTKPQGSGLGLPIAHKIIQLYGGNIDLIRSDKFGSLFHVRLPALQ